MRMSVPGSPPGSPSGSSCHRRRACRRTVAAALVAALLWLAAATAPAAGPAIDVNVADAATLAATLPGIGPVKARAIVEHRERHGPFVDIDDLLAVRGIGPVTLEKLRRHLGGEADAGAPGGATVAPPAAAPAGASSRAPRSTSELERESGELVRALIERAVDDAGAVR